MHYIYPYTKKNINEIILKIKKLNNLYDNGFDFSKAFKLFYDFSKYHKVLNEVSDNDSYHFKTSTILEKRDKFETTVLLYFPKEDNKLQFIVCDIEDIYYMRSHLKIEYFIKRETYFITFFNKKWETIELKIKEFKTLLSTIDEEFKDFQIQ
jgi:hypothetical protein